MKRFVTKFNKRIANIVIALILTISAVGPLALSSTAYADTLDPFPSTNQLNKDSGKPYVELVSSNYNTVVLKFVNPRPQTVWFEQRVDDAAPGSGQYGPCRVGNASLPSGCQGKRYLAADDYSFSSVSVTGNSSVTKTYKDVQNQVSIRSTFGPERQWDFDWVAFNIAYGVCVYDFPAQKMWEVTWGYDFAHRNGGAPVFTMQSHGGLITLNNGPLPSYMANNPSWHWLYAVEGVEQHYKYGFADHTIRTVDVTYTSVNGCQIPTIVWGMTVDNQAPKATNISIVPTINNNIGRGVTVYFDLEDESNIDLTKTRVLFADGPSTPNQAKESAKYTPVHIAGKSYKVEINTLDFLKQNFVGNYNLQFNMYDSLGNHTSSKPAAFRPILIDNSGPSSVLTAPTNNSTINGVERFVFETTDNTGVSSGYVKLNGPTTKQYNLIQQSVNVWYADINTEELTDGAYTVDARFIDSFGTPRYGANKGSVIIDNTDPEGPTDLAWTTSGSVPVLDKGATNQVSGVASWEASASSDVHHYIYKYWNDIVGNQYKEATPWVNSPVSGTSLPGSFTEGEGVHYFSVAAVDHAGNISAFSAPFKITYDKTAPPVTINEISSTTDPTPEITGTVTGSDVNKVEVSFDNGATWQLAVLNGNDWSYQVSTPLTLGNITVQAKATDNAGNTTSPVASETFTVSEPEQVANGGGTPTAQTATTQGGGLPITPFAQDNDTDVLGEQDTNTEQQVALENDDEADNSAVAGATDEGDKTGDWTSPFGLAWYWWLLILAAVIGGLWWFFAARRAAKEE